MHISDFTENGSLNFLLERRYSLILNIFQNIKEFTADTFQSTKEATADVFQSAKEITADAFHNAREVSTDTWENAKEVTANTLQSAKEVSADTFHNAREVSTDTWENAKEVTANTLQSAKEVSADAFQKANQVDGSISEILSRHSLLTILVFSILAVFVFISLQKKMDYKVDEKMNDLSNEVDNSIQLKLDEIESKLIELNENLNFSSADGALNYAEETFRSRRKTKLESICKDIQNIDLYLRIHGHQEKHSRQRKKIEDLRKELSQKLGRITTGKTVLGLVPYFNKVSSVINNLKGSNDE